MWRLLDDWVPSKTNLVQHGAIPIEANLCSGAWVWGNIITPLLRLFSFLSCVEVDHLVIWRLCCILEGGLSIWFVLLCFSVRRQAKSRNIYCDLNDVCLIIWQIINYVVFKYIAFNLIIVVEQIKFCRGGDYKSKVKDFVMSLVNDGSVYWIVWDLLYRNFLIRFTLYILDIE